MKAKKIAILLILPFFFSECSDYLDVVPDNLATLEIAFKNKASAEKYLFTCYSFMPEVGKIGTDPGMDVGDEVWYFSDNSTDFSNKTTFWITKGMQNTNSPLVDYWNGANWGKSMFRGLRDCNIFIENIDLVPDLSPYDKARWKSEIKVLKAYYHFWLMRMYGPIPIIDKNIPVSAKEDEVRVSRNKIDDVVSYITSVIDEAVEDLPLNIQNEASEKGRITRPAALALKAKILAYAASPFFNGNTDYANFKNANGEHYFNQTDDITKWEKAAAACDSAIKCAEEAGHELYEFVNQSSNNLSSQTILSLTQRCKVTERWNNELLFGCGESGIKNLQIISQPWLESNYSADGRYYNASNGTFAPTLAVAETFYTENGVPIEEDKTWDYSGRYGTQVATNNDKYYIQPGYTTAQLHFKREPRFYATLGFDGSSWYGIGKMDDNNMWYLQAKAKQTSGKRGNTMYSVTGYFAKKPVRYQNVMESSSIQIETYPFPIIRLADLYLLYAECLNEADRDKGEVPADCYTYIDKVRERAGLKGVKEAWTLYSSNPDKPNSYEGFQSIVRQERLIELALEGQRFWDIRRWNLAIQYFNKPMKSWDVEQEKTEDYYKLRTYYVRGYEQRDNLWPLRNYDLVVNPKLEQNPGW